MNMSDKTATRNDAAAHQQPCHIMSPLHGRVACLQFVPELLPEGDAALGVGRRDAVWHFVFVEPHLLVVWDLVEVRKVWVRGDGRG